MNDIDELKEIKQLIVSIKSTRYRNIYIRKWILTTGTTNGTIMRISIPIGNKRNKSKLRNFLLSLYFTIKSKITLCFREQKQ